MICVFCQKPLLSPLDQYGHCDTPSCFTCWTAEELPCINDKCEDGWVPCEECDGLGFAIFEGKPWACSTCEGTCFYPCDVCDGRAHITAEDTFNKPILHAPGSPLLLLENYS